MALDADKEPHAVPSEACKPQQNNGNGRDWEPGYQALLCLKKLTLEWLEQHNCNKGAADCIPGADTLIGEIKKAKLGDVAGYLFHAHLVRGFHESEAFKVDAVEVRISPDDKRPKDIRLLKPGTSEYLFVEAWRGKTRFSHAKDNLAKKKSGGAAARLEDDAQAIVKKYEQLPPGKGFVINHAIGTDQSDILPIARLCTDRDKCVITVRSDMRAYVYGPADFRHMEDVLRICGIFGWCPNDMLGKLDSADIKVISEITRQVDTSESVRRISKPALDQA